MKTYRTRATDQNNDGAVIADFQHKSSGDSNTANGEAMGAVNARIERYTREKNTEPPPRPCIITREVVDGVD